MQEFDVEASGAQMNEGFTQLTVRLEPSCERIDDPLSQLNDRIVALDVLNKQQTPAGSQDPVSLSYRATVVGDRAQ